MISSTTPRNIVITGFMGTGKTTVGALLARRLGWEWIDTDAALELRHGPIPEIFAAEGERAFRRLERTLAAELAGRTATVISTGGGLMLDVANVRALAPGSRVFCLVASPEEVLARVAGDGSLERPLLAGPDPVATIRRLLAARDQAYRRFPRVSATSAAEEVVDEIAGLLDTAPTVVAHPRGPIEVGIGTLPFLAVRPTVPSPTVVVTDDRVAELHGPLLGETVELVTIDRNQDDLAAEPEAATLVGFGGRRVQRIVTGLAGRTGTAVLRVPTTPAAIEEVRSFGGPALIDVATLQTLPADRQGPVGPLDPPRRGTLLAAQERIADSLTLPGEEA